MDMLQKEHGITEPNFAMQQKKSGKRAPKGSGNENQTQEIVDLFDDYDDSKELGELIPV